METFYEGTLVGSAPSMICETMDHIPKDHNPQMEYPEDGLSYGLLTHLHFHALETLKEAMMLTFLRYSLPTCLDNLKSWHVQAMDNELSCYGCDDQRREASHILYQAVRKLLEAVYVVYCPRTTEYSPNVEGEWSNQHEIYWNRDEPLVLTKSEFENPTRVIEGFRRRFGWEFIQMELWDWLVAAVTGDSDEILFRENRKCLMDFYVHLHYMLEGVFYLSISHPYD